MELSWKRVQPQYGPEYWEGYIGKVRAFSIARHLYQKAGSNFRLKCLLPFRKPAPCCEEMGEEACKERAAEILGEWLSEAGLSSLTRLELLQFLEREVRAFRQGAAASIARNSHMNDATGTKLDQRDIDALLVDFINFVGARQCVDYALNTEDVQ